MKTVLACVVVVLVLAAAPGASQSPSPRLQRPAGHSRYMFKSTEQNPDKVSAIELQVGLTVKEGTPDVLTIESGRVAEGGGEATPIQLSESCVREFGGRGGTIGSIELTEGLDPARLVPQCVPEGLFGATTDLVSILLVHHKFFGITALKVAGDSSRFPSFNSEWSRNEPAVHARVAAPGGAIRLATLEPGRAIIEWRPDPMEVTIVRRVAPSMAVVLRGQERFGLEVTVDPRTGALVGARSTEDRLDLQFWPVQGSEMPSLTGEMPGAGRPVTLVRAVSLVPALESGR